ncbi:MAG TPA: asparaginase [Verrucomicrobiae bacterium]|nr:asparaginase [Verrucomicrobiae bacterium]
MSGGWSGGQPLVEVWRGDHVESVHSGGIAVADARGRTLRAHGDPEASTYLRSAAKPAQVLPLLMSGAAERFGLIDAEIAVMIGSHGGEPMHVEAVRSILDKIGLPEAALQCGAHAPFHRPSAQFLREAGRRPSALHNNCSGKHAGMLALARQIEAPVERYLEEDHPVQRRIRDTIAALASVPAAAIPAAIDGCSAPTFALSLAAAATLYARLVEPEGLPSSLADAAGRAVAAMRRHPDMVAGTDRLCSDLMRASSAGLIAKIGAEGFYGLAWLDQGRGRGAALKIGDGDDGDRARPAAALALLRAEGALTAAAAEGLTDRYAPPLKNHRGLVVGRLRVMLDGGPPESR